MNLNDLTRNTVLLYDNVRLCRSKRREDILLASDQVWEGGVIVCVRYGAVGYIKITNGRQTFSELDSIGDGGDGPTTVTSVDITDSTAVGRSVLTAANAAGARSAIGAGTSNLVVGSGSTQAAAGNHTHGAATTSVAGFMSGADKTKLDGVATGATANDTNANLLNRANHTGTQAFSTISGVATAAQIPNLAGNKITAITGYTIGTAAALAAADSLNAALGKLEARVVALETAGG